MRALFLAIIIPLFLANALYRIFVIRKDWFAWLSKPVDLGGSFLADPTFGTKPSWRGILVVPFATAIVAGTIGIFLGSFIIFARDGFVASIGYVLGDLSSAYIKRKLGFESGATASGLRAWLFYLIDHSSGVIGASVLVFFFRIYQYTVRELVLGVVIGVLLHILIERLLVRFHLNVIPSATGTPSV